MLGWIPDIRLIQFWIELSLTKQDSKCREKNTSKFAFLRKYTRCSLFIQRYFRTPDIQSKYPAGYKIKYRVQQQKNERLSGPQMNGLAQTDYKEFRQDLMDTHYGKGLPSEIVNLSMFNKIIRVPFVFYTNR